MQRWRCFKRRPGPPTATQDTETDQGEAVVMSGVVVVSLLQWAAQPNTSISLDIKSTAVTVDIDD